MQVPTVPPPWCGVGTNEPKHRRNWNARRRKPVHVHDFHTTILKLMDLDHEKLADRHAGLDFRLAGVEGANVVKELLA